jgi:hypothetical protein
LNEWQLVGTTLPTWFALNPEDVVLCFDKPAHAKTAKMVKKVAKKHRWLEKTKILEVSRNPEYTFHQAWVRRSGFREATSDVILTGDIDQSVNSHCLKAIAMAGKNQVGLASLQKFYVPKNFTQFYRTMVGTSYRWLSVLSAGQRFTGFTGLYAFYRPFWMETEPEEETKRLVNPKQSFSGEVSVAPDTIVSGEDVFLRKKMATKYQIRNLPAVGAVSWRPDPVHYSYFAQRNRAIQSARLRRSVIGAFIYAVTRALPYYFPLFMQERSRLQKL